MSTLHPSRVALPADRLWERSRWEWRRQDGGDPAALLEDFLAGHGLPVRNLAATPATSGACSLSVIGATLFVSSAAGAAAIGAPPGRANPAPSVPELVAVVWALDGPRPRHAEREAVRPARTDWQLGPWQPSWSPAEHAAAVSRVRRAIGRGDVYQVNLVGHASAAYTGDPLPALRRVTALPGARYPTLLRGEGWAIGCASPETLVTAAGGRVTTRPIKGTRPATAQGRAELLDSDKERAEHVMIVDLERNDLARIARTGSVTVADLYAVRRWCDLWQAESVVSAALADGVGLADLLRAVCPGGSVTGAPKRAALELIGQLEPVGRGASMGALGWVGRGELDLGLTIRTAAVDAERVHLWAGGGITWSSDPAAEVAEAAAKAAPLRQALAQTRPTSPGAPALTTPR